MNFKKRILSVATSLVCAMSCLCISGSITDEQSTVEAASVTGLSSFEITSQMKIGWNLGNSLDATSNYSIDTAPELFTKSWGNPAPTTDLIKTVHDGGFNTIRIPTTWYMHMYFDEESQTYKIDDTWMEYVKNLVDYAYNLDMFVILNVHHENWVNVSVFTDETYAEAEKRLSGIWTRLAEEFKDYDQRIIFEGMNEPRETGNPNNSEWGGGDTNSWNYINKLNEVFVNTVRNQGSASNAERLLMLPGYCASNSVTTINNIAVPEDSGNVALSVHAYTPYFFAMDTSDYSNHTYPGKSGWGADYTEELKQMFKDFKSIMDAKNVPIILGEFSASDFNNTESRVNWATDYLTFAKEVGIPCVLWDNNVPYNEETGDNGEAHGYVYRLTNTWYNNAIPVVEAMMKAVGVTDYVLPEYKEYVAPTFSWDDVEIGDDWIELYHSNTGYKLDAWKNMTVSNWRDYVSEDYEFVMFYDSTVETTIIFQGGWYTVNPDVSRSKDFTVYFNYEDIVETLANEGTTVDDMTNMFISANSAAAKIYGLYAVPVGSGNTENTESTDDEKIIGDLNLDGNVTITDIVILSKYLVKQQTLTEAQYNIADVNADEKINVFDLVALRKIVLNV